MTLLGLVDTDSSNCLGKIEVITEIKDVVMKKYKKEKWKIKAGTLEESEFSSITSMKLPQLTKRRECYAEKLHPCNDLERKYDIILGRDTF